MYHYAAVGAPAPESSPTAVSSLHRFLGAAAFEPNTAGGQAAGETFFFVVIACIEHRSIYHACSEAEKLRLFADCSVHLSKMFSLISLMQPWQCLGQLQLCRHHRHHSTSIGSSLPCRLQHQIRRSP
jgi:hypothetical protein